VEVTRKGRTPSFWISGDITVVNAQRTPYPLADIRLALYPVGKSPETADALGTIPVKCGVIGEELVVPARGNLACSFDSLEPTGKGADAAADVWVIGRSAESDSYDLLSKSGQTVSFAKSVVAWSGHCINVGAAYNSSGPDKSVLAPLRMVSGNMPGPFEEIGEEVCKSSNYTWVAEYGPQEGSSDCGDFLVRSHPACRAECCIC
jgi:hypothetical protein